MSDDNLKIFTGKERKIVFNSDIEEQSLLSQENPNSARRRNDMANLGAQLWEVMEESRIREKRTFVTGLGTIDKGVVFTELQVHGQVQTGSANREPTKPIHLLRTEFTITLLEVEDV